MTHAEVFNTLRMRVAWQWSPASEEQHYPMDTIYAGRGLESLTTPRSRLPVEDFVLSRCLNHLRPPLPYNQTSQAFKPCTSLTFRQT